MYASPSAHARGQKIKLLLTLLFLTLAVLGHLVPRLAAARHPRLNPAPTSTPYIQPHHHD